MKPSRSEFRLVGILAVVALVATAGCLSGPLGTGTANETATSATTVETSDPQTDSPSRTGSSSDGPTPSGIDVQRVDGPDLTGELDDPVECKDGGWVSYWGTGGSDVLWQEPGELRTGWTVPANQSTLFVAFQNTTVVGVDDAESEQRVTADGDAVEVEQSTGEGRYAVVMVLDVNGNGAYDPDVDRPCRDDSDDAEAGDLVRSDWLWVDWSDDE